MARPKKKTVDYFPHIIKTGKTITILENRFGNDGYAFWFKLLEVLGSTKGHSYRYENPTNKEFLYAKTNVSQEKAEEILNLLADLEAIDPELWEHNIIWSDNFIENIEDVYKKRSNGIPQKPVINNENSSKEGFSEQKPNSKGVSGNENTQSKLKETKLKESKRKKDPSPTERKILKIFKSINNYPFEFEKDIEHIRELMVDYPGINMLGETKKWKTYKIDNPLKKKSNARLQFRNWMKNASEWSKEDNKSKKTKKELHEKRLKKQMERAEKYG